MDGGSMALTQHRHNWRVCGADAPALNSWESAQLLGRHQIPKETEAWRELRGTDPYPLTQNISRKMVNARGNMAM